MKIDGKKIAQNIREQLIKEVFSLSSRKIYPKLSVILIGSDPGSKVYVNQKEKTGAALGIKVEVYLFTPDISGQKLNELVAGLNQDKQIHGIIIQRPVPLPITANTLNSLILPQKDVDGFHPKSEFDPPVALAVWEILKSIFHPTGVMKSLPLGMQFHNWLDSQKILIIGRGETAGRPIANYIIKKGYNVTVAHSQSEHLDSIINSADILISCVGKPNIVRHQFLKRDSVLIGVGLHPEETKLAPDYIQNEVKNIAAYYTPVPGGVGPVNVAMLMANVVKAAKMS